MEEEERENEEVRQISNRKFSTLSCMYDLRKFGQLALYDPHMLHLNVYILTKEVAPTAVKILHFFLLLLAPIGYY